MYSSVGGTALRLLDKPDKTRSNQSINESITVRI